ncbi:hypothetical protein [Streptomyces antimycoticus]|uniref:hypothetical protein n=1 Tax=Streptomyces antimycoticus TaxID=68175 RepID=UPI0036EB41E1|nr:hypothetical protein OG751_04260 [Streptomyces antimycoticus]
MYNPDAPLTKEEFIRIHNIGQPAALVAAVAAASDDEGDEEEFDHGGCFMPHRDRNGEYIDCDGRPL